MDFASDRNICKQASQLSAAEADELEPDINRSAEGLRYLKPATSNQRLLVLAASRTRFLGWCNA
jgi:hypothetical protein